MPRIPGLDEIEAVIREVAVRIGARLHELEGRLPAELKPTVHQLESLIVDEVDATVVAALRSAAVSSLYKTFTTGKGEVKHSPADLA